MFDEFFLNQIKNHAIRDMPKECCGLVLEGHILVESKNMSPWDQTTAFLIDPSTYLEAVRRGKVIGYYHSHHTPSSGNIFSETDIKNFRIHGLLSICYNTKENQFYFLNDTSKLKYLGRKFAIGKDDCFTLVRDYYWYELGIGIADYSRDSKWFIKNPSIWVDNIVQEGGVIVIKGNNFNLSALKMHDILLSNFRDIPYPSHASIYLGRGMVLHHPASQNSTIEPLVGELKTKTSLVVRHRNLIRNE